jgi:hypothetical protein
MEVPPETVDIERGWFDIVVLRDSPVLSERGSYDSVYRITTRLLINIILKEFSDGGKDEFFLAVIERAP